MKRIISAMVIILMLSMTTMVYAEETEAADYKKTGGWTNVSHEAEELPEEAQEAFDKATENLDGAEYTPVALLSTQLVAGMNAYQIINRQFFNFSIIIDNNGIP